MTRRQTISRSTGILSVAVAATFGLVATGPVHAEEPPAPEPVEEPAPEPADDAGETGEVDGDTVAVGLPPVPTPPVETGVDDGATVAVGQPPVPANLVETGADDGAVVAVGTPPVPAPPVETGVDDGATVAVGQPPVPAPPVETGEIDGDTVAVGTPPVPTPKRPAKSQAAAAPAKRDVPAAARVVITPAMLRSTADAAFGAIEAWF